MSEGNLLVSVLLGGIGIGYFIYGRRQGRIAPFLSGIGLFAVPYVFDSTLAQLVSALALIALPFVLRF